MTSQELIGPNAVVFLYLLTCFPTMSSVYLTRADEQARTGPSRFEDLVLNP